MSSLSFLRELAIAQNVLPPYLEPLPETDPAFEGFNSTANRFVLGDPGQGGLVNFEIVTFTEEHDVYRVYGGDGKASMCGFWWTLSPPGNIYPANPLLSADDYLSELFAVCPEWNDATEIIRCNIPVGYNAIVGIGQTADCADGTTLIPSEIDLQLNGPICNLIQEDPTISCTFCKKTDQDGLLQLNTCVQIEDYPGFEEDASSGSDDKKGKKKDKKGKMGSEDDATRRLREGGAM